MRDDRAIEIMTGQPTDRRIDRLIHLLVENATVVLPGPKIAAEIGVTRSTIWAWMEKLRSLGVDIQGHPSSGYQLRKLPDVLTPSLLRTELGDCSLGRKVIHYFTVGSTNTEAMNLAARGAAHGTVVVAEEQTAGRGRFGRAWYSEKSAGIYASIILRPAIAPAQAPVLALAVGLAAQQAIEAAAGMEPDLRWPNDLLLDGKKLGGILTEMSAEIDRVHAVVAGIGLNVNQQELPPELALIATSLRIETGKRFSRLALLASLLKQMEIFYDLLIEAGSEAVARRWEASSSFAQGKRVRVRRGGSEAVGITAGLDVTGALRVRFDDGRTEALVAGEVLELK
ncbi:MAG: biotin--[acetyl-CoA-carboxylase] ligase [Terriglobia bacterium]